MSFQKDFLWGSASAAYQIEGAANIDGKGDSIWDVYSHIPGNTFKDTNGDVAIDFYHKYKEDIALMKEQGLKSYRFSVSWPRILPKGSGEVNPNGIEFYHNVIDELIKSGVEPILTVYHWDLPQALQDEYEGWEGRKIVEDFTNYCRILFEEYGDKVKYWVTINEQNVYTSLGYLFNLHPPKIQSMQKYYTANHHAFLANASAIKLYKEMGFNGMIGPSLGLGPFYSATCDPKDIMAMEDGQELGNFYWTDIYCKGYYSPIVLKLIEKLNVKLDITKEDEELLLAGTCNMLGVNYYSTQTVSKDKEEEKLKQTGNTVQMGEDVLSFDQFYNSANNQYLGTTQWGWTIDPAGLRVALRRMTSRYNLPLLITENGLGAYDELTSEGKVHDQYRIDFLKDHFLEVEKAIEDGCNVLGFATWSFQDLFSWLNGYAKRYGFVYVDRDEESEKELKRYKKDSFYWYKEVMETNGGSLHDK